MNARGEAFEATTVAVLRCVEEIFGADRERDEEFFYVANRDNRRVSYVGANFAKIWGEHHGGAHDDPFNWLNAICEEDRRAVEAGLMRRAEHGSMDLRYRICRPDGQLRTIVDRSFLLPGGSDGEPFVIGRCQDITPMLRTQQALADQELLFAEVAVQIEDVFWIRTPGPSGGLVYVSPAFAKIFGRPCAELLNRPSLWAEAIHPDDRAGVVDLLSISLPGPEVQRSYRIVRSDGEVRHLSERTFILADADNGVGRLVGVAHDFTAAHRAAQHRLDLVQAKAKQKLAQAQVRARDNVLAIVSHDLRNPLCAIDAAAQRLSKPLTPQRRDTYLAHLRRASARMNRLLDDLLDVSRMEAGHFSVSLQAAAVRAIVDEALAAFADRADGDTVSLAAHLDETVPESIVADPFRIVQVLTNLVGNALKFTRAGGRIDLYVRAVAEGVQFEVADTGVGIDLAHQQHLFDRFWQVDRSDRRGAGLGLSIVKGIVDAHGGRIWVHSTQGEGSHFYFVLPRRAAPGDNG